MDVESDEEQNADEKAEEANQKAKESMPPPLPPLPPQLDNVLIRKDYNPKTSKAVQPQPQIPTKPTEAYVISPITGEKIPADKLQEHMRFGLLDPRWVEQRDRTMQEKMQQEEVYAVGSAIESSLKQLAERRTDIFGSGDEEAAIGKKIGEEEKRPEKVTWDGHTATVEATTRAARANITIEEQIQQIHKIKGLLPEEEKDKIGPAPPSSAGISSLVSSVKPMGQSVSIVTTTMNTAPSQAIPAHHPHQMMPTMMMHQQPAGYMMAPTHMMMGMYGVPMQPHDLSGAQHGITPMGIPPPQGMFSLDDEPAYKRLRTEDNLIPEEEFLRKNNGNVNFKVQVPVSNEKAEWKLNGQILNFTLPYTDTLTNVKAKISEQIGMPPGKQKLQYEGIFVKDSNSLAFYNVPNGALFVLGLKERGGRKK